MRQFPIKIINIIFFSEVYYEHPKDNDGTAYVGLTDFAQSELGDLVYVNLPQEGDTVTVEESFADVESVKAVSDVYSPISGTVEAVNEELLDAPQLINETPYEAWLIKVADISAEADFLTAEEYEALISE